MTEPDDHGHLGDLLSGLLDGNLSPEEEATARRHLADCATCRAELEETGEVRSRVRALPAVDPPFVFYERLLREGLPSAHGPSERGEQGPSGPSERGEHARGHRRRAGVGFAALAASAAAALTVVVVASPQNEPVTPRVDRLVEAHATAGVTSDPVTQLVSVGVPVTFAP